MRTIAGILVCVQLLCGCSLLPRAPRYTNAEIQDQATKFPANGDTALPLEKAKKVANGWRTVYADAQDSRRDWQLAFGEIIFYGSILAVLGVATHHDRVRNVGAGLAGTSSLLDGHYQLSVQLAAFRKAEGRAACIEKALTQITPAYVNTYASSIQDAEVRATLTELPVLIVGHMETIRNELSESLRSITLTNPSRDDIVNAYKNLTKDIDKAGGIEAKLKSAGIMAAANAGKEEQLAFLSALTTVRSQMDVCVKT